MPYICLYQEGHSSIPRILDKAQQNNYTVAMVPINYKEVPRELLCEHLTNKKADCTYPDLLLTSEQWNSKVILTLSEEIDCDSCDENVRKNSEYILQRDISWAEHLQYGGYIMLKLKSKNNVNLARVASNKIKGLLLVQLPLYNASVGQAIWRCDIEEDTLENLENEDTWIWWNNFRRAADFNPKIKLVLEFNECERPSEEHIRRWLGEPVEAVIIPSTMFIRNRHNFPVLPKAWQEILIHFVRCHVNMIVSTANEDSSLKLYTDYLISFREMHKDSHALQIYEDVLETPLQPLYDNLDCYTYEIFERDPLKYKLYQDAIESALIDRVPEEKMCDEVSIVMVLGAGRGPLVRSALNAAENTKRKIRVYIIEKNENAIRTLTAIAKKLWHNKDIHIFSKDMRQFAPPEKADILVSELLGSLGDNELSPECLDCAQKLLKADGISIPCKSTSYINPIMSSKLYNAVRAIGRLETFGRDKQATYHTYAESGFVVMLKNVYHIDEPQPLFVFEHPNRDQHIDNSRYKVLHFAVKLDCVLNGLAGYFDCILYKDIKLSINPLTHTVGMFSWFPMFFPFSEPLNLRKGQSLEVHFWRSVSKQKIWYEWSLAAPHTTHIHNHGGRSCPIYCT